MDYVKLHIRKGHPNFYLYDRQFRHFHMCSNNNNNDDDNREKVNQ